MKIQNKARISQSLIKDVMSVVGGIYRMNAPHAKGYVFNVSATGKSIANGMFLDRIEEKKGWDYYLNFSTGVITKIR